MYSISFSLFILSNLYFSYIEMVSWCGRNLYKSAHVFSFQLWFSVFCGFSCLDNKIYLYLGEQHFSLKIGWNKIIYWRRRKVDNLCIFLEVIGKFTQPNLEVKISLFQWPCVAQFWIFLKRKSNGLWTYWKSIKLNSICKWNFHCC